MSSILRMFNNNTYDLNIDLRSIGRSICIRGKSVEFIDVETLLPVDRTLLSNSKVFICSVTSDEKQDEILAIARGLHKPSIGKYSRPAQPKSNVDSLIPSDNLSEPAITEEIISVTDELSIKEQSKQSPVTLKKTRSK